MTKTQKIAYYVLTALLSLGFLFAAYPKLIGDSTAAQGFQAAHLPIWFMYFIGACEVIGVIGLWIPKLARWASYGLGVILAGAIVVTVFTNPIAYAIVPVVFAIVLWIAVRLRNKKGADAKAAAPAEAPDQTPKGPAPTPTI